MDRYVQLRRFATKEGKGIEIGPWCNPITPKSAGYNCLILDVFDAETLRQKAFADDGIPDEIARYIEQVELVGSSTDIGELVGAIDALGSFDYIVSSHNFEHIPDPIKFLRGCAAALRAGGTLTMAIPDKRGCFDYFRPLSTVAQIIEANFQKRAKPTRTQIFERFSMHARSSVDGHELIGFPISVDPETVSPFQTLEEAFSAWNEFEENPNDDYVDTHCWTFTPASIELILRDVIQLRLAPLELVEVAGGGVNEFYVHLRKPSQPSGVLPREQFYEKRAILMKRMLDESSPTLAASLANIKVVDEGSVSDGSQIAADSDLVRAASERLLESERARREAEATVAAMVRSRSWRLTAPVRSLRTWFGTGDRR